MSLEDKLDQVIAESRKTREISEIAEQARTRLTIVSVCIGLIMIALLGVVLWVAIGNRDIAHTIACYTTPGEPCYEEQQTRSEAVIMRLVEAQIAVVECQSAADIHACVEQKLSP